MQKLLVGAVSTFALVVSLCSAANALEPPSNKSKYKYRYSIKFICGWYDGSGEYEKLVPGYYATAINVYNPHDKTPDYYWNPVYTYPESPPSGYDTDFHGSEDNNYESYNAFEIDCYDLFYGGSDNGSGDYNWDVDIWDDTYVKGFVSFWSDRPWDVTAVYTACPGSDGCSEGVSTMQVQQIEGRKYNSNGWGADSKY